MQRCYVSRWPSAQRSARLTVLEWTPLWPSAGRCMPWQTLAGFVNTNPDPLFPEVLLPISLVREIEVEFESSPEFLADDAIHIVGTWAGMGA
jgi:hypothetical protein